MLAFLAKVSPEEGAMITWYHYGLRFLCHDAHFTCKVGKRQMLRRSPKKTKLCSIQLLNDYILKHPNEIIAQNTIKSEMKRNCQCFIKSNNQWLHFLTGESFNALTNQVVSE